MAPYQENLIAKRKKAEAARTFPTDKEGLLFSLRMTGYACLAFITLATIFSVYSAIKGPPPTPTLMSETDKLSTVTLKPTQTLQSLSMSLECEEYDPQNGKTLEQISIDLGNPTVLKVQLGSNVVELTQSRGTFSPVLPIGADVCK